MTLDVILRISICSGVRIVMCYKKATNGRRDLPHAVRICIYVCGNLNDRLKYKNTCEINTPIYNESEINICMTDI